VTQSKFSKGFSLLELLVVVVIIGILATMFTLSVGLTGSDRDLQREVDRLRALLQVAGDDAILEGREFGISFFADGYEFAGLDPDENRWVRLTTDPVLKRQSFDESLEVTVSIEGRELRLQKAEEQAAAESADESDDDNAVDPRDEYRPQVYIFSSGDLSPAFELRLRRRNTNEVVVLAAKEDSSVEVTRENF
jgi:general secretion pathway protein H